MPKSFPESFWCSSTACSDFALGELLGDVGVLGAAVVAGGRSGAWSPHEQTVTSAPDSAMTSATFGFSFPAWDQLATIM
jgi:hypothetical protein